MILVTFSQIGTKMTSDAPVDDSLFLWMALSLQWFSQNDIMDGIRARRQKSGSPLGRIIDEALDMTQQACYSLWIGYLFRLDNLFFEMMIVMINIVFYSMEMKYILCKNLNLNLGEVGPVEVELGLTVILLLGYWFGSGIYQQTLFDLFAIENSFMRDIQFKYVTGGLLTPLLALFLYDNLGDCLKDNFGKSVTIFTPCLIHLVLGYLISYTASYSE